MEIFAKIVNGNKPFTIFAKLLTPMFYGVPNKPLTCGHHETHYTKKYIKVR